MPRIEMNQVYKEIESRRVEQIKTALEKNDQTIPYSFNEFKFDMMANDLVLFIPTIRNKWDAAQAKGIITVSDKSKPYQKALLNVNVLLKVLGKEDEPSETLVRDIYIDTDIHIQQVSNDEQKCSESLLTEKENEILKVIRERFKIARGRPVDMSKILGDFEYEGLDVNDAYHGIEVLKGLGQIREIAPGQYEEVGA